MKLAILWSAIFHRTFLEGSVVTMTKTKMKHIAILIIAFLVVVNHKVSGKKFDCEEWKGKFDPIARGNIICGDGDIIILF